MARWPLIILGVGLLGLSIVATVKFPPLPLTPEDVTVTAAVDRTLGKGYHHVALEGRPDMTRKIYPTACRRPVYTGRSPDGMTVLLGPGAELPDDIASYLGTVVKIDRPLADSSVALQTVRSDEDGPADIVRERLLTPFINTDGKLWAISPAYDHEAARPPWYGYIGLVGALTRLSDIDANMAKHKLEHSWAGIKTFAETEFKQPIPDDAYLIVTEYDLPAPYFYCPIVDSGNALFLDVSTNLASEAVITGILEIRDRELYKDFETVLGTNLPERIGILRCEDAAAYNKRRADNAARMRAAGTVLLGLGILGVLVNAVKKKTGQEETA